MASDRLVHTSARQSNAVTHPSTRVAGTLLPRHRNAQKARRSWSWRLAPKRISGLCHSTSPCPSHQHKRKQPDQKSKPAENHRTTVTTIYRVRPGACRLQTAVYVFVYMRRQTKNNLDVSGRPESSNRRQHAQQVHGIDQCTDEHGDAVMLLMGMAIRSYAT